MIIDIRVFEADMYQLLDHVKNNRKEYTPQLTNKFMDYLIHHGVKAPNRARAMVLLCRCIDNEVSFDDVLLYVWGGVKHELSK